MSAEERAGIAVERPREARDAEADTATASSD